MQQSALEALADELGEVAGGIEREAKLRIDALLADLARRDAERELRVVNLERRLEERLASLRDGEPGASVSVDDVAPLIASEIARQVAALPPAEPGSSVTVEDVAPMVEAEISRQVAALPPAEAGRSITNEDVAPMLEEIVARRVAALPPAEPGRSITVEDVQPVLQAMVDALPPAEAGRSVTAEDVAPMLEDMVARRVAALPPAEPGRSITVEDVQPVLQAMVDALPSAEPGRSVTAEDVAPLISSEIARQMAELPPAEPGRSVTIDDVAPLLKEMVDALPPAAPGQRGEPGPEGRLPTVKAWEDRVHYEGELVTHDGSTFQAARDTGRAPPHEDWTCLARAGRDGVDGASFAIEGTFDAEKDYRRLSVVTLNGGSFVARRDNPGPCPGDGWQLQASQGKRGQPGERGPAGNGARGPAGPAVTALRASDDGVVTLVNADGSAVELDLYPLLSKLQG